MAVGLFDAFNSQLAIVIFERFLKYPFILS